MKNPNILSPKDWLITLTGPLALSLLLSLSSSGAQAQEPAANNYAYLPAIHNTLEAPTPIDGDEEVANQILETEFNNKLSLVGFDGFESVENGRSYVLQFIKVLQLTADVIKNAGLDPSTWDGINRSIDFLTVTTTDDSTRAEQFGNHVVIYLNINDLKQYPSSWAWLMGNETAHLLLTDDPNQVLEEFWSELHAVNIAAGVGQAELDAATKLATTPLYRVTGSQDLRRLTANMDKIVHPANLDEETFYSMRNSIAREMALRLNQANGGWDITQLYRYKDGQPVTAITGVLDSMEDDNLFTQKTMSLTPNAHVQVAFRDGNPDSTSLYGYTGLTSADAQTLTPDQFFAGNNTANLSVGISYVTRTGQRAVHIFPHGGTTGYTFQYDNQSLAGGIKITYPEKFSGTDGSFYNVLTSGSVWIIVSSFPGDPVAPTRTYRMEIGESTLSKSETDAEDALVAAALPIPAEEESTRENSN